MNILVIGDSHVEPGQDLTRFSCLGRLLTQRVPDVIISIGDFISLDSLSSWDKDKRKLMEGRRYKADIDAGNAALDLLEDEINSFNTVKKRKKQKQYEPRKIYVKGNHEDRLDRYCEQHPEIDGSLSVESDLHLSERGWEVVPYREGIVIGDIWFGHVPISNSGRAISGQNITRKALELFAYSVVFGHTHRLEMSAKHRHGQPHLQQALNCGCFFSHVAEYTRGQAHDFWRGVCLLHVYHAMRFDIETFSLSQVMEF